MAKELGDVAAPAYPGTVLEPNDSIIPQHDDQSMFGQEATRPEPAKNDAASQEDTKRFQYWQSKATKADNELKALQEQYKAIEPVLPLVNVISRDRDLQDKVRQHLGGPKPLEAPQRPESYNEVEAYSAPGSESFKYRTAYERYRDEKVAHLEKQLNASNEQQQAYLERTRQAQAQQQAQLKFQEELIQSGINPQDVPEFFNLVNGATKEDMIDYFMWKKSASRTPNYEAPAGSGFPQRPSYNQIPSGPVDVSADLIKLAREFR